MKRLALFPVLLLLTLVSFSQRLDSTALILIDIQDFYFPGGRAALVEPEKAAEQAKKLLNHCKQPRRELQKRRKLLIKSMPNNQPVIHQIG